jgi:hypothetical protein
MKKPIVLYRAAKSKKFKAGEFWTDDINYARFIHPKYPVMVARLSPALRIIALKDASPSRRVINFYRKNKNMDVLIFPIWDWPANEYVILNPKVLLNVKIWIDKI